MTVLTYFVRGFPKVNADALRCQRTSFRFLSSYRSFSVMHNKPDYQEVIWNPVNILNCPSNYKYAVIVLDRPISLKESIVLPLWEKAQVTLTVDGGTNRWIEYLGSSSNSLFSGESKIYAPTMITGDMDSICLDIRDKLKSVGTKVITTPNQNRTDYTKALMELSSHCKSENVKLNGIYVLVDTTGRFDHIIGNINTLYKTSELFGDTQVIQVASNSLTWLLRPGKHRIIIPEALVRDNSWCGLLPFGNRIDKIHTTGLKWNLDNLSLEFGGLVSTSNTYDPECTEVTIDVNDTLVWTMGIEPLVDYFGTS